MRRSSAVERLKLAAAKLRDLEGEKEALPEEYIPAAFVVEEVTKALDKIHEDLYPWDLSRSLLTRAHAATARGALGANPRRSGQPRGLFMLLDKG